MEEGTLEEVTRAAEVMQAVEAVRAVGAVGVELPVADLLIDRGQRGIRMRPKGINPMPPPFPPYESMHILRLISLTSSLRRAL